MRKQLFLRQNNLSKNIKRPNNIGNNSSQDLITVGSFKTQGSFKNPVRKAKKFQTLKHVNTLYAGKTGKQILHDKFIDVFILNKYYERIYIIELLNAVYAFISIVLSVTYYEFEYKNFMPNSWHYNSYLYFVTIFSFLLWVNIIFSYLLKINFLKENGQIKQNDTLISTGKWAYLLIEIFIFFIHPNIFTKNCFYYSTNIIYRVKTKISVNAILSSIVLFRFYYVFRFIIFLFDYMTPEMNNLCREYFFKNNLFFNVKIMFKKHYFLFYNLNMIISQIYFCFSVRIFERELTEISGVDFNSYWNTIWYIVVTMFTIGYGDYASRSNEGRMIIMAACIIGILLNAMLLLSMSRFAKFSIVEKNAYRIMEKVKENKTIEKTAIDVMQTFSKCVINKNTPDHKNYMLQLKNKTTEFHQLKSLKKQDLLGPPINNCINSLGLLTNSYNTLKSDQMNFLNELKNIKELLEDKVFIE